MSSAVMILRNAANQVTWDSRNVAGGLLADVRTFAAAVTAVLTYPAFPGRSVRIIPLRVWAEAGTLGVTVDTALGYPRVTIAAGSTERRFAVEVF